MRTTAKVVFLTVLSSTEAPFFQQAELLYSFSAQKARVKPGLF
jgi:hypothetical protein